MATVSYESLFKLESVTEVVNTIKTPNSRLQNFLGMNAGGPNVEPQSSVDTGWDIFNTSRTLAHGRAEDQGPDRVAPTPVGHVSAKMFRSHEYIHLSEQKIFHTRPLGGGWGEVDERGQRYVRRQAGRLTQRDNNAREYLVSRALRGVAYLEITGASMRLTDTAANNVAIDFQLPANNKNQLNGIIGASWAVAGTDILRHLDEINAKCVENTGYDIRHAWLNSTTNRYLRNNDGFKTVAGSANRVFSEMVRVPGGNDGIEFGGYDIVYDAAPWITFHVYDGGLDVAGTFTKFFANDDVLFHPEPDGEWLSMYEGPEVVAENILDPGRVVTGRAAYTERTTRPPGFDLVSVDNFIPALKIPSCVFYADVTP